MKNISYSIVSRGTILITYKDKTVSMPGELTFEPPVFYVETSAFNNWDTPFESEKISANEQNEIIEFLSNQPAEKGTKIVFD